MGLSFIHLLPTTDWCKVLERDDGPRVMNPEKALILYWGLIVTQVVGCVLIATQDVIDVYAATVNLLFCLTSLPFLLLLCWKKVNNNLPSLQPSASCFLLHI